MTLDARLAMLAMLVGSLPFLLAGTGIPFDEPVGGARLGARGEPVVDAGPGVPDLPAIEAVSWLIADADSGDVLAARNAHDRRPPASTIKLLTALALLPDIDRGTTYVATEQVARIEGSRVGLVPDERYSISDLEHGLLLASGNDAAYALAELAGGTDAALEKMNAAATRLGAYDTVAKTPDGMDDPGQLSSAYDLALIGRAVLADDALAGLTRTRTYDFPGLDGETFQIQNQNRLLGSYDGAVGLKTGFTSEAGHTLVAAAERDGIRLVATVLDAEGRAEPLAAELLDWGFAATGTTEPVGTLVTPEQVADAVEQAAEEAARAEESEAAAAASEGAAAEPGTSGGRLRSWAIGAAAAAVALVLMRLGRRRRRRRRNGRYAA